MMVAEVLSRLSRFVTLFVLAAHFSNSDYGLAMLALVIHELFRVFTRLGIGAKIIQCRPNELHATLENAASLQWLVALAAASCQILLSQWIAEFYAMENLGELLKIMALAHLLYPIVSVRIFEQHRQNKLRYYGVASGFCIAFENLLVAFLVWVEASVFAVAYAKLAAAIFWVVLFIRLPSQLVVYRWEWRKQKALIAFSLKTLTSESSRMMRYQMDSIIAARLLSPDLFGLYSFAKSAGLGIAQSFSQAYLSALYPYLCKQIRATTGSASQNNSARSVTLMVCGLFLIQSILAIFYVEWFFGDRWVDAKNLVALLCLIAIPALIIDHYCLVLRAQNKPSEEMKIIATCTIMLAVAFLLIQPSTAYQTALVGLGCSLSSCFILLAVLKQHSFQNHFRSQTV
jgi:O-antigen/teichoic acid export membrane protein